ncbi:MAG: hypothetical protein IJJ85_07500 [Clostridia bacterium]|nr:hypothetical protein [Clostridia bacterium]
MTCKQFFAALLAFFTGVWGSVYTFFNQFVNDYAFTVDTAQLGEVLPNVKSNINRFGGRFPEDPVINTEYDPYEFVDYIQLMECSGGNRTRDLFVDPDDFDVIDDYDFDPLIRSCRGILKTGAKPLLKLGNVPAKLSRKTLAEVQADLGAFDVNIYPPDDYDEYYRYIRAIAEALCAAFSPEEIRQWRFGVMTEYENIDWFRSPDGDPGATMAAYCKLYDYTVQALIDVLGPDVFVGAHSMTCSEGLWDEKEFIRHCASGVNYATGGTGSRICYLSASYYETAPGERGGTKSVAQIMQELRGTAEDAGLTGLIYGVDEGRILLGRTAGAVDRQLNSRTVGYTYQAAFDARLVREMFETGMNYFSSWEYCSLPDNHGNPTVSYFVAKYAARFEGARLAAVQKTRSGLIPKAEVEASAAFDETTGTLRLMAYNYKNKLNYLASADVRLKVHAPQFADGEAQVTVYTVDDDCNWFDEWQADREALGITDDCFAWSPDDGCPNWADSTARATFEGLTEKYASYIHAEPETYTVQVKDGSFTLDLTLEPHAVAFADVTD